jgi:calcium-dependent protein kinase
MDLAETTLNQLKTFNSVSKLKDAIYNFIAAQILTHKETAELRKAFSNIDKNHDGHLTTEELLEAYTQVLGATDAFVYVENIMKQVDIDRSGKIEYTEFIAANVQQSQ